MCIISPRFNCESRGLLLLVVTEADIMAGRGEGTPGDVEPAVAGQELVGILLNVIHCVFH